MKREIRRIFLLNDRNCSETDNVVMRFVDIVREDSQTWGEMLGVWWGCSQQR